MEPESDEAALAAARQALERGDWARAATLADAVLARRPDSGPARLLRANAAILAQDLDTAISLLRALGRTGADHAHLGRHLADLHNRRGSRRRHAGDEAGALDDFGHALELQPGHDAAGFNAALALRALRRHDEAAARLAAHLQAHPDDVEARLLDIDWCWREQPLRAEAEFEALLRSPAAAHADARMLAATAARLGHGDVALQALQRLPPAPRLDAALAGADALRARGLVAAAADAGELAWQASDAGARSPGLRGHLLRLALPPVMGSHAAIAADRLRLARVLEELDAEWSEALFARCEPALEQLAWTNFHLAYHGQDDRTLQQAYAALLTRAAARFAPDLADPPAAPGTRRVGLLSSCWRECTAGSYFGGWIDWLRAGGFEVHLYQLGPQRDDATARLATRADRFRFHDGTLRALADHVRGDRLDLLIYPELGMDARLLPLAALRLAPRQLVGWGHPVTSGFAHLDGRLTCAAMEPDDGAAQGVETPLSLPGLGVDYARPAAPPPATRAELGLPTGVPLVLVPQSLFKLHPDDDVTMADLARRAPAARFVLFRGEHPAWQEQYETRLRAAFRSRDLPIQDRLLWLATGSRTRFLQIARACDLMLDSRRWSGGNTSLDALCVGLPLLACPGATMRARQSSAMLRLMGLEAELVCDTPEALVARAVELLDDPGARARLRKRIAETLPALFDPGPARVAFLRHAERFFTSRAPI